MSINDTLSSKKPRDVFTNMLIKFENCRYKTREFKRVFGRDIENFLIKEPIPFGFDIIALDDSLIKEHGDYCERDGINMNQFVAKTFGKEGVDLIEWLMDPPPFPIWHGGYHGVFDNPAVEMGLEEAQVVETVVPEPVKEKPFMGFDIGAAIARKLNEK